MVTSWCATHWSEKNNTFHVWLRDESVNYTEKLFVVAKHNEITSAPRTAIAKLHCWRFCWLRGIAIWLQLNPLRRRLQSENPLNWAMLKINSIPQNFHSPTNLMNTSPETFSYLEKRGTCYNFQLIFIWII